MHAAYDSTKVPLVGVVEDDETGERPHQPTRGRDGHGCDPDFDECAAAAAPVGFALRGFLDVTVLSSPLVAVRFEAPPGSAHRARLDRDHAHAADADARARAAEKAEQERRRALLSAQQRRDDEQRARDAAAERALADALEAAQAAAQAKLEAAAQASAAAEQSKAFNRTQWDTWRLEGRAFDFDVEVGFEIGVSRERTRALHAYKRPL
jgi:flagellar biosynthesis GTPase FlhF